MPKWLHPVDCHSLYTKNCTGEFSGQEVRKLKIFYCAVGTEADATLGRCCSDLFFFLILIGWSLVGGKKRKVWE